MEKKAQIAICHDSFLIKWGAERMNILIARHLGADIVSSCFHSGSYQMSEFGFTGRCIALFSDFWPGIRSFLMLKWWFALSSNTLSCYPTVIFSNEAITGWRAVSPRTKKIYYAHSISRHLYDQKNDYLKKLPVILRPIGRIGLFFLRLLYESDLRAMDLILTNSPANATLLRSLAPKVRVEALYPPVDLTVFYPRVGDLPLTESSFTGKTYYISFSRLTHSKRIDHIIRAFILMPDKNILFLHGENDPQKSEFYALAAGYKNIQFLVLPDNTDLPQYISGAIATIAISKNEDFGMISLESMACGIPVIAVDEWWYQVTVGEGGVLLPKLFSEKDLQDTVYAMTPEVAQSYRDRCSTQVQKFSLPTMLSRLDHLLGTIEKS